MSAETLLDHPPTPPAATAPAAAPAVSGEVLDAAEVAKFDAVVNEIQPTLEQAGQLVVTGETEAQSAGELLKQLKGGINAIEKVRKETKQPHLDRTRAIDRRAKELTAPLEAVFEQVKGGLAKFLREQEDARKAAEQAALAAQNAAAAAAQAEADATAAAAAQVEQQRTDEIAQAGGRRAEIAGMTDADLIKLALTPPSTPDARTDREMATAELQQRRAGAARQETVRAAGAVATRAAAAPAPAPPAPVDLRSAAGSISQRTRTVIEIVDERLVPRMYCSVDMTKLREAIRNGITDIAGVRVDEVDDLAVTAR